MIGDARYFAITSSDILCQSFKVHSRPSLNQGSANSLGWTILKRRVTSEKLRTYASANIAAPSIQ
jgi:hypothetical protein